MEDLFRAGGLAAVLREVQDLLDPAAISVTGRPFVEPRDDARIWDPEVIRARSDPLQADAGIAVLRGSLAPDGAVIKPAAASAHLLTHRGRALVFDSAEDAAARLADPDLDVDADSVLDPARLRPARLSGDAGGRQPAAAAQAARPGRARHGPHLGRADERHGVRHGRAARRTRGGGRWPARARPDRRHGRPGRAGPATGPGRRRPRNWPAAPRASRCVRPSPPRAAAGNGCTSTTSARPTRGPTSISSSDRSGDAVGRDSH